LGRRLGRLEVSFYKSGLEMCDYARQFTALVAGLIVLVSAVSGGLAAEAPDVPESAYGEGAVDGDNPRVESRLVLDNETVEPGGQMRVGVVFSMDPDWHIYWRNSGQAGMATGVEFAGEDLSFGSLKWPAPHAYEQKGEVFTFGYGDQVMLFTEATVADSAEGKVTVEASVNYLACKVDCIPGSSELEQTIPVADEGKLVGAHRKQLFDRYSARVPRSPEEAGIGVEVAYSQKPVRPGDEFRAAVGLDFCREGPDSCRAYQVVGEVDRYRFIPDATSQVSWTTRSVYRHPSAKEGQVLGLEGEASPNAPNDEERLSGVVWLKNEKGEKFAVLIDQSLPRGESGADVEQFEPDLLTMEEAATETTSTSSGGSEGDGGGKRQSGKMGFLQAVLFAFLGGMILNLMPCVFPVLALKVTSFAELVHEDRSHKIWHGIAYTAGIVVSMLVLAGAVLGLRAAGTTVGWGFQFQNPVFPALLAAVVVVFALNLFGVFEIHVESTELAEATRKTSGLRRSAGEGVLAVVLATPCSAPFLGTAVGFALTAPPITILTIFAAIGLGLAAPFVVFAMMPGWSSVLPRPGNWMVYVKKFLGFTLVGAAIWLVWIVGRATGVDGMMQLLVLLGMIALATWVYGESQTSKRTLATVATVLAIGAAGATGVWALDFPEARSEDGAATARTEDSDGAHDWQPWSEDRVDELLDEGRPVFVDFTADWCITCKVNERTVLSTDEVVEGFDQYDVATLKADWTDGDERITRKLREFGKGGVPMYLVYSPARPEEPEVLPEVLTSGRVVGAVEQAAEASND
jgi:thiol:disulfide interchange protein DsbD